MTDRQKRKEAIEHANRQCPKCGAAHGQTVRTSQRTGNLWMTSLQLAHPDHDPWNPDARTEMLCNDCHMSKDGPLHATSARRTRALQKNGNARRYRRNSVSNHELTRIVGSLGIAERNQRCTKEGVATILCGTHRKNASRLVPLAVVCYTLRVGNVGDSPY